jgi:hypothetical protein
MLHRVYIGIGYGSFSFGTPLPQAMPLQRPCSSLCRNNRSAASRQAKRRIEPFQVVWPGVSIRFKALLDHDALYMWNASYGAKRIAATWKVNSAYPIEGINS